MGVKVGVYAIIKAYMSEKGMARSVVEGVAGAAPGVAKLGCYALLGLGGLVVVGGVVGTVKEMTPQMECIDIPTGMGPEGALRNADKWNEDDPFPVEVRVPWPSGDDMQSNRANDAETFYPPYGILDFNFGEVPDKVETAKGAIDTQVCYDRRKFPPPTLQPQFAPTPQSFQRKGQQGHHVVYSSSGR